MEGIVSKKSFSTAILHFITAGVMILSIAVLLVGIFSGYFFEYTGPTENFEGLGHGFVAAFSIIAMIISMASMLIDTPVFIFSGVKLIRQAKGALPSKKSFIATIVVKSITFFLIATPFLFLFSLENGFLAILVHAVALVFSLTSSLLEAHVRRKP